MTYMVRNRGALGIIESYADPTGTAILKGETGAQDAATNAACLATANAKGAQFEAKATDLSKNWNPTGYYSVKDVQGILDTVRGVLGESERLLRNAANEPMDPAARSNIYNELGVTQNIRAEGMAYQVAIQSATSSKSTVIDAPGLKRWVVKSMLQASHAATSIAYLACVKPAWVSALFAFGSFFERAYAAIKVVAGMTWAAVKAIGATIIKVPDLVSNLITFAKWGVLLGGGAYLFTKIKQSRGS